MRLLALLTSIVLGGILRRALTLLDRLSAFLNIQRHVKAGRMESVLHLLDRVSPLALRLLEFVRQFGDLALLLLFRQHLFHVEVIDLVVDTLQGVLSHRLLVQVDLQLLFIILNHLSFADTEILAIIRSRLLLNRHVQILSSLLDVFEFFAKAYEGVFTSWVSLWDLKGL